MALDNLVPYRFQTRTAPIPLAELDTDLDYISQKSLSVTDKKYGATPGVGDSTAAIQAAIDDAIAQNTELYFPKGLYFVSSTLVINGALKIRGAGRASTGINWTSNTLTAMSIVTSQPVEITSFGFFCQAGAPSAGGALSITGSGGAENTFTVIRDCQFSGGWDQVNTAQAYAWVIDSCRFTGAVNRGVLVRNTLNPDFGDSTITNCMFYVMGAACTLVEHASSGGLRLIGNKFLSGIYGYRMLLDIGVSTTDLIIVGNSFENQTGANLRFNSGGGGANFSHIVITGNQFGYTPTAVDMTDASAFLDHITISDNIILLPAAGAVAGISITNSTIFEINGNVIDTQGGTPIGISIGASCTSGMLGVNHFGPLMGQHLSIASANVIFPPPNLIGSTGVAVAAPADVNENVLATFQLPPRAQGLNGRVLFEAEIAVTLNGNAKTINFKYGATVMATFNLANVNFGLFRVKIINRGANNSQLNFLSVETNGPLVAPVIAATAVDTTVAQTMTITGTKGVAGDNIILNEASATLYKT